MKNRGSIILIYVKTFCGVHGSQCLAEEMSNTYVISNPLTIKSSPNRSPYMHFFQFSFAFQRDSVDLSRENTSKTLRCGNWHSSNLQRFLEVQLAE